MVYDLAQREFTTKLPLRGRHLNVPDGKVGWLNWAADGETIAFFTPGYVTIYHLETGASKRYRVPDGLSFPDHRVWSPARDEVYLITHINGWHLYRLRVPW